MVAIVGEHDIKINRSTYEILQILGFSLLDKTPVNEPFNNIETSDVIEQNYNQLSLSFFKVDSNDKSYKLIPNATDTKSKILNVAATICTPVIAVHSPAPGYTGIVLASTPPITSEANIVE